MPKSNAPMNKNKLFCYKGDLEEIFIEKIYFQNLTNGLTSMTKLFRENVLIS